MLDNLLRPLLKARAEKKLPQAIMNHDLAQIGHCLERGARKIDFLMMVDGDRYGEKVPAGKFDDPVKLAEYVRLPAAGMNLLARAGLTPAAPQVHPPRQG